MPLPRFILALIGQCFLLRKNAVLHYKNAGIGTPGAAVFMLRNSKANNLFFPTAYIRCKIKLALAFAQPTRLSFLLGATAF